MSSKPNEKLSIQRLSKESKLIRALQTLRHWSRVRWTEALKCHSPELQTQFAQALRPWENHLTSPRAACYLQTWCSPAPDMEYRLVITRYWNYKPCVLLSQHEVSGQAPTKECAAGRLRRQQPPKDARSIPQLLELHYPTRQKRLCRYKLRSQEGQSSSGLFWWPKDIPKVRLSERRWPGIEKTGLLTQSLEWYDCWLAHGRKQAKECEHHLEGRQARNQMIPLSFQKCIHVATLVFHMGRLTSVFWLWFRTLR